MSIEEELRKRLTAAMKAKDTRTADVIRMINTKLMERRTAKGFAGQVDDTLHVEVISAYKKLLTKAREEFLALGEKGREHAEKLQFELEICNQFLPQGLSEAELRTAIRSVLETTGIKDPKQIGRVVGEVMKAHKGRVDASAAKRIAEEELNRG